MSIAVEPSSPEPIAPPAVDALHDAVLRRHETLDIPEASQPVAIEWDYLLALTVVHAAALLAFLPWFFSWAGVATAIAGHFLFGMLGITIGYHRLLTHQGFTCPKWFEHALAILGICTFQDSPARWVAIHRMHHKESDQQPDPHSPLAGLFWGHVGWLLVKNRDHRNVFCYERYVRDLLRDPFYVALERRRTWFWIYVAHAALITAVGFAIGWFSTGTLAGAGMPTALLPPCAFTQAT